MYTFDFIICVCVCATHPIRICDMTHSQGWHDSFIRVTLLIHMCDMTISTSHIFSRLDIHIWFHHVCVCVKVCYATYLDTFVMRRHDMYICTDIKVKSGCNGSFFFFFSPSSFPHVHRPPMSYSRFWYCRLIHICDWLIHTCHVTHSYVFGDSLICVADI